MDCARSLLCVVIALLASSALAQREHKLLDFGWRFHLGNAADPAKDFGFGLGTGLAKAGEADGPADPDFDDHDWRRLNLPHDWAVELPFVKRDSGLIVQHGFKPLGREFPENSIGWYRRTFDIAAKDLGRRISIEFDGVFRNSQAWLNGHRLGREESGYSSFAYDVTELLNYGGSNTLVVRVDASEYEGWFYEGAGIYRHVWILKTPPVHVARNGVFVSSEVDKNTATISIQTEVQNDTAAPQKVDISSQVLDPKGKSVATISTANVEIGPGETRLLHHKVKIAEPALWSLEAPQLYTLVSTVGGDSVHTNFGIRTIRFDPDKGFFLNGKHVVLKGMCNHQDHAGVGAALPDRLQDFRVERLKAMGCNAYRTSHNPPTPELLDACDRLGMLVMDENRLIGTSPWILDQQEQLVRRDRNHPSVILWSIGNEEPEGSSLRGERIAQTMVELVHRLDPTRPTTYAGNNGTDYEGINKIVDVRGFNYIMLGDALPAVGPTDTYHKDHPQQPIMGSEEASTLATRGEYKNDPDEGYMSAYDTERPSWGSTAEHWWKYYAARPYLAGAFVWTGFDYRGEPTPYQWPCISSHFGVMDTCGYPKDDFYYYQAWWNGQNMIHILPHWNWAGREGQQIPVWVYSNLDEVELFLNGKSLGRKPMPRNGHVEWQVAYAPGTLEAKCYRSNQLVKSEKIETTGGPAKLVVAPDRSQINADGEDVSVLKIYSTDAQGRWVPVAGNDVTLQVTGGNVIGVGNGDPSSHERDRFLPDMGEFQSNGWRINFSIPKDRESLTSPDYDDSDWRQTAVGEANQIVSEDTEAVFRGFIDLPDIPKGTKVTLYLGRIDDEGSIYLNGAHIGGTDKWDRSYTFDVEAIAHGGRNYLTVFVKNKKGMGGLGRGVMIKTAGLPPTPHRALFNGLAQAIVQSTTVPGVIHVKATSPGLQTAEVDIKTVPAQLRGY